MNPVCAFSVRFVQLRYFYGSKRRSIITSAGFSWVIFKNFIFIKGDKIDVWSCKWSKEVRKSYRSMPMSRFRPDKRYANCVFLLSFFLSSQSSSSKVDTGEIDLSRFTKNFSARAKIAGARRFVVGSRWNSSSPVEYLSTFLFLFVAGRSNLNIRSFRVLHFSSARYSPSSHYL